MTSGERDPLDVGNASIKGSAVRNPNQRIFIATNANGHVCGFVRGERGQRYVGPHQRQRDAVGEGEGDPGVAGPPAVTVDHASCLPEVSKNGKHFPPPASGLLLQSQGKRLLRARRMAFFIYVSADIHRHAKQFKKVILSTLGESEETLQ